MVLGRRRRRRLEQAAIHVSAWIRLLPLGWRTRVWLGADDRYNVTPSAAYTYKPAYHRYGHKINVVHFIGPNKPWANLAGRPAGMSVTKKGKDSYDCELLGNQ